MLIIIPADFLPVPFFFAEAAEIRAFHNINQLTFKQIFGLPSLDNSPLTEPGKWLKKIITNVSNNKSSSVNANGQLANDIETFRGTLLDNYGLRDNLQLSEEVVYVSHNSSFQDNFIYDWHDFFQHGAKRQNLRQQRSDLLTISL